LLILVGRGTFSLPVGKYSITIDFFLLLIMLHKMYFLWSGSDIVSNW